MYCESNNHAIHIYCSQQDHLHVPGVTLDGLSKLLPVAQFVRIGKSHIINREIISYLTRTPTPLCRLVLGGRQIDLPLYASNVERLEKAL
ncbi:hypothetical protein GCM10027341_15310 [Spirosoma knui]